jgi:hypothetical protein
VRRDKLGMRHLSGRAPATGNRLRKHEFCLPLRRRHLSLRVGLVDLRDRNRRLPIRSRRFRPLRTVAVVAGSVQRGGQLHLRVPVAAAVLHVHPRQSMERVLHVPDRRSRGP